MKWLLVGLVCLAVTLQYRLWVGDGSIAHVVNLNKEIEKQRAENERMKARNELLAAEVYSLKEGLDAVEERARTDMGMIKRGETFFMILGDK